MLTHYSTVYPDVKSQDADDVTLQPMLLAIRFSGRLPRHLMEQNIPIEISVSLAEEFGCFAMPVVQTMSFDQHFFSSLYTTYILSKDFELSDDFVSPANDIPIPFLPLPSEFNYTKRADWEMLSKRIEAWLIELDTELPQWTWGRDMFWLTFIAAFPAFPRGTWHMWNPRILLEGAFIEQWLETSSTNVNVDDDIFAIRGDDERDAEDLSEIWDALCRDAALFYPYTLIADD
ncbi:hypothetical protein EV702DRAFT_959444 [Suillus placidus]|uniref:Uncharacterized protein n=1 Tax=Suillus placidus TaxID=48579 RepID=A0A9P7A6J8_9AGAM|nr:hypothetical protein EV702DRAFT_959444 [Suillus placidus]